MSNDHLIIKRSDELVDATLTTITVPSDEVGPAHKKNYYNVGGQEIIFGYTKSEALKILLEIASEHGWQVLKPLN